MQDPLRSWLKANLTPPFLEHLSFRLGNQNFFLRIEDVEGKLEVPGNREGLLAIAEGCKGYPCLMPMRQRAEGWAEATGWGIRENEDRVEDAKDRLDDSRHLRPGIGEPHLAGPR